MKFCTECGKKLPDTAKFCDECGTKLGGGEAIKEKKAPVAVKDIAKLLDDDQAEKVKDIVESFKEDNECERIHVVGEDGFEDLVANFVGVIKSRGGDESMAEGLSACAIALIDNSKTGQGKRGTLITRVGLFVIDKEIPNYEDGSDDDGGVPWALFARFGEPLDEENYNLLNVETYKESDEVEEDVKERLEYSDVAFLLRFSRLGLEAEQIAELMSDLKSVFAEGSTADDDDDDADEAEEDDDDDADEAEEADDDEIIEED